MVILLKLCNTNIVPRLTLSDDVGIQGHLKVFGKGCVLGMTCCAATHEAESADGGGFGRGCPPSLDREKK